MSDPLAPTQTPPLEAFKAVKPKPRRKRVRRQDGKSIEVGTHRQAPRRKRPPRVNTLSKALRLPATLWDSLDHIMGFYNVGRGQVLRKMLEDGVRRYGPATGLKVEPEKPNPFEAMSGAASRNGLMAGQPVSYGPVYDSFGYVGDGQAAQEIVDEIEAPPGNIVLPSSPSPTRRGSSLSVFEPNVQADNDAAD